MWSRTSDRGLRSAAPESESPLTSAQKLAVVLAPVLTAGMWLYVSRVVVVHQQEDAFSRGIPRGNLSDLYPRWLGSRELLLNHRDPYGAEVTREIQTGYYGRPLDPASSEGPHDQQAFAYPVYVALLLAPTVKLSFPHAQEVFRWLLAFLTMVSVPLWMRFVKLKLSFTNVVILTALTLGTFAAVQGIRLQQLSLLVAVLIATSACLLIADRQVLAGALLAFASVKPQLVVPLAAWLALWALSDLRLRWKFAASFAITLSALIAAGEYLLPRWPREFFAAVIAYRQYTRSQSLLDQLATPAVGVPLAALVVAGVASLCWRARKRPARDEHSIWVTSMVLAATVVVIPTVAPYNQLLLLPGAFLLVRTWRENLKVGFGTRILLVLAAGCVAWPWLTATALALISFFTPGAQLYWQLPLWTSLFIPIPIAACLALFVASDTMRANPLR